MNPFEVGHSPLPVGPSFHSLHFCCCWAFFAIQLPVSHVAERHSTSSTAHLGLWRPAVFECMRLAEKCMFWQATDRIRWCEATDRDGQDGWRGGAAHSAFTARQFVTSPVDLQGCKRRIGSLSLPPLGPQQVHRMTFGESKHAAPAAGRRRRSPAYHITSRPCTYRSDP